MTWKALLPFLALLVGANLAYVWLDHAPFTGDDAAYFAQTRCWVDFFGGARTFAACYFENDLKPELWTACGAAFLRALRAWGRPFDVVILAQQLFLVVALLATYAVARRAAPLAGRAAPLLAVAVTAFSPLVFGLSRRYLADLPLTAAVWAALALLLATDRFRRPWISAAFGLTVGLGMLTRPTFAVFLIGPVLLAVAAAWRRRENRRAALRGLALAAPGCLIAAPWYGLKLGPALRQYGSSYTANLPWPWREFSFSGEYVPMIWREQLGWVFAALAALGLVRLLASSDLRARYGKALAVAAASLAPPAWVLGTMGMSLARYALPVVPLLAIVLAVGWLAEAGPDEGARRGWRALRRAAALAAVVWGVVQFAVLSFADPSWARPRPWPARAMAFPQYPKRPSEAGRGQFGLDRRFWPASEVCAIIDAQESPRLRLLTLGDRPCGELQVLHGAKGCLTSRDFLAQFVDWRAASAEQRQTASLRAWPDLLLLAFQTEEGLLDAERALELTDEAAWSRAFRAAVADGWAAVYVARGPRAAAPPPTVARAGDCVQMEQCVDWCVQMNPRPQGGDSIDAISISKPYTTRHP